MMIKLLFSGVLAALALSVAASPAQAYDFSNCHFEERCEQICLTPTSCERVCFTTLVCDTDDEEPPTGGGGADPDCIGLTGAQKRRCQLEP